jgi:hypothetical protein
MNTLNIKGKGSISYEVVQNPPKEEKKEEAQK